MVYFCFLLYITSLIILYINSFSINNVGCLLLYVSSTISAYKFHEYLHYDRNEVNLLNKLEFIIFQWLSSSIYFDFEELKILHSRHHILKIDNEMIYEQATALINNLNLSKLIFLLEYIYIPIVTYIYFIKLISIRFSSISKKNMIILIMIIAVKLFLIIFIAINNVYGLICYCIANIIYINTLRFLDAFQHTYDSVKPGYNIKRKSANFEMENTYTLIFPSSLRLLQRLTLNFNLHNAHHLFPKERWYNLPKIHRKYREKYSFNEIPLFLAVKIYHINRMKRLIYGQGKVLEFSSNTIDIYERVDGFYGALAIPFVYGIYNK